MQPHKEASPPEGDGSGGRQAGSMQRERQQQQQQQLPPHLRGSGGNGGSGSGGSRPSSRGPFQGGPRQHIRPGSGPPMRGGGGQQHGFPGNMHGGGMPGNMPRAMAMGSGGGGGGNMGGWAGVNPAAARAMLLAQQQGQPWGNEQLPMFQNMPGKLPVDF